MISTVLGEMLWEICRTLLRITNSLEEAFLILAGVKAMPGTDGKVNLLSAIFKWNGNSETGGSIIAKLFMLFLLFGLALFVVSIVIGLIKANMNKDVPGQTKKVLVNSLKALIYFALIPIVAFVFINAVGDVLNLLIQNVASISGGTEGGSISQNIFELCVENHEGDYFDSSFDSLKGKYNMKIGGSINYFLIILVSCILLFSLGIATINLVERIINIILLYIISPGVVAVSAIDNGARLSSWKDKVIAKYIGVIGNVLSMYIFLMLGRWIGTYKESMKNSFSLTIIYFCIIIGGSFMACKGSQVISSLVSQNEGVNDGLSQGLTQGLARAGMGIAGGVMRGFGGKAAIATKGTGGNNTGGSSGSGGAGSMGYGYTGKASPALERLRNKPVSTVLGMPKEVIGKMTGGQGAFGLVKNALDTGVRGGIGAIKGGKNLVKDIAQKRNPMEIYKKENKEQALFQKRVEERAKEIKQQQHFNNAVKSKLKETQGKEK